MLKSFLLLLFKALCLTALILVVSSDLKHPALSAFAQLLFTQLQKLNSFMKLNRAITAYVLTELSIEQHVLSCNIAAGCSGMSNIFFICKQEMVIFASHTTLKNVFKSS